MPPPEHPGSQQAALQHMAAVLFNDPDAISEALQSSQYELQVLVPLQGMDIEQLGSTFLACSSQGQAQK